MFWQIFFTLLVIVLVLRRIKNRKLYNLHNQLKTDFLSVPVLGHAYLFLGSGEGQYKGLMTIGQECLKRGGPTSYWLGNYLMLVVADADHSEFVMKKCLEKADFLKFAKAIIGNGSVFAPVPIWRARRKMLLPIFTTKNLSRFVKIFAKKSNIMATKLRPKSGGEPFPIWYFLTSYTMDSVCETTMGANVHAQENSNHQFPRYFDEGSLLVSTRIFSPWMHSNAVFHLLPAHQKLVKIKEYMVTFIGQIIKAKREEIHIKEVNRNNGIQDTQNGMKPFLHLMIEETKSEKGCNDLELLEESLVLTFAATDTSAVGLAFTIVMLMQHPEVQEKVYAEIKEVFGDSDRPVEVGDLPHLKYLEAVIKETLRLCPPAPVIVREVDSDVTMPSGVTLVKGTIVMIHIWAINRNPKYWGDDAAQFKPERFLNLSLKHPGQYMSFSHGPRNCLGYQYALMSAKTVLSTLLRQYRFLPVITKGNRQPKPLRIKYGIMVKDTDNFMVRMEPRV